MPTSPGNISTAIHEYPVVRLNKDNLGDLTKLYSEIYKSPRSEEFFAMKYDTAYTGVKYAGFIAYKNGQPVSYFGVVPCFIQYKNEIVLAAQAADAMTQSQHRYKGLFIGLSKMTYDLCKKEKIQVLFGFPNQDSYPTMVKKLDWIETEKMERFTIPVKNFLNKGVFKNLKKYREEVLRKLELPQKGTHNSVIEDGYAGIYKNEAYLQYKSFTDSRVIKVGSSQGWIKTNKELIIGDILLKDNDDVFFSEIKKISRELGVSNISFQVSSGCRLHALFASRYQAVPSFPVLLKDFGSGLPIEKIKFTFSDIDIF